jgi:hypothetical protein
VRETDGDPPRSAAEGLRGVPLMARIRSLKPELADDAKLAGVSISARYSFVLLISKADDDGLIPGAHRQLLGLLYPHNEDVTVARCCSSGSRSSSRSASFGGASHAIACPSSSS